MFSLSCSYLLPFLSEIKNGGSICLLGKGKTITKGINVLIIKCNLKLFLNTTMNDINMYSKFWNVDCQKAMSIIKLKNAHNYTLPKDINERQNQTTVVLEVCVLLRIIQPRIDEDFFFIKIIRHSFPGGILFQKATLWNFCFYNQYHLMPRVFNISDV